MIQTSNISAFISRLAISLVLLMAAPTAHAQLKVFRMEKDSIPLFRGFQVSFDLVGAARLMFGDRGEIGGGLRINLHDQWFPVVEFGIGKANHDNDEATYITYKTTAPYFRVGIDINLLKNKHQSNRLYGGIRYGFTSYKVDITRMDLEDPIWGTKSDIVVEGMKCSMHWFEVVFGIDAKIWDGMCATSVASATRRATSDSRGMYRALVSTTRTTSDSVSMPSSIFNAYGRIA